MAEYPALVGHLWGGGRCLTPSMRRGSRGSRGSKVQSHEPFSCTYLSGYLGKHTLESNDGDSLPIDGWGAGCLDCVPVYRMHTYVDTYVGEICPGRYCVPAPWRIDNLKQLLDSSVVLTTNKGLPLIRSTLVKTPRR